MRNLSTEQSQLYKLLEAGLDDIDRDKFQSMDELLNKLEYQINNQDIYSIP